MIVLEDCDLVAEDRSFTPYGNPLLFTVLDEMDGLGSDIDACFLLTTNRVDLLEPALAQRPGRVDLAVEIPPQRQFRIARKFRRSIGSGYCGCWTCTAGESPWRLPMRIWSWNVRQEYRRPSSRR